MFSIRSILTTMAFFSAIPLSLAAPPVQSSDVAQYKPNELAEAEVPPPVGSEDDADDDI